MRITQLSFLVGLPVMFLLGFSGTVQAQNSEQARFPGVYLGASWGSYSIKQSEFSKNDHVLKTVVGGQLNNWFGLEGSWTDFNRTDNGNGDKFKADGMGVAAVLSLPVGATSSAFLKGGQFWWKSDSALGNTTGASSGNDPFWGVGFKFGFNEHLALRLEAERYDVWQTRISTVTAGLEFKF